MLIGNLGSTETGQLMGSYRPREQILEWDWMRPSEAALPFLRFEPQDDQDKGICELVVLNGWPSKVATNREDGAYATRDLFERHPRWPEKNWWRYYARKDDTIVLVNGEKANPLLLEGAARESPLVAEAVVFGAMKPHLGLFVLPTELSSTGDEIVEAMWPRIEQANRIVPAHARLGKDMVQLLPPETAALIRKTDKGTVIRAAFYEQFSQLIDAAYEDAATEPRSLLVMDEAGLRSYVREAVIRVVPMVRGDELVNDRDLFSVGIDSLQASQLRAVIVRKIDVGGAKLGQNFVFDYPSINALARELFRLRNGSSQDGMEAKAEERMQALIDKYFASITHIPVQNEEPGNYILVTGGTGSLGAHLIAQLLALPTTTQLICLARAPSDAEARTRIFASLHSRCLSIPPSHLSKLQCYASDLSTPTLGLQTEVYASLTQTLTTVIHAAWTVNFNLSLSSFEDCIAGTHHLLALCLRTQRAHPASFVFCSSVSAVAATPSSLIPEELPDSLDYAQKTGYAQSKLVAEHISLLSAEKADLDVRILRIGQIMGDTRHGVWNAQEAIPLILQSAGSIGALPRSDEWCSWLPVDTVATAVIELGLSSPPGIGLIGRSNVYHVVNHRTFHWTHDFLPMLHKAGLDFEEVDSEEWLGKVREVPDVARNPTFKLVTFFEAKYGGEGDQERSRRRRDSTYSSENARAGSPALAVAPVLDHEMVATILQYLNGNSKVA